MNVLILATCRRPELLNMATMVFKTFRVGFPKANLTVFANGLSWDARDAVRSEATNIRGSFEFTTPTIHHEWIERLVENNNEPFWICDTDVIFYESIERFDPEFTSDHLAGWRIPEWRDSFSGAITRARLHTSLLRINPKLLREKITAYEARIAETPFTPKVNLFYPLVLPFKNEPYFYDTGSLLYHAVGGRAFTEEQKSAFCHFNFGTIPDIVLPRLPAKEASQMEQARRCIMSNPSWGIGAWRSQEEFYNNHLV
jgi:hypothetical protein